MASLRSPDQASRLLHRRLRGGVLIRVSDLRARAAAAGARLRRRAPAGNRRTVSHRGESSVSDRPRRLLRVLHLLERDRRAIRPAMPAGNSSSGSIKAGRSCGESDRAGLYRDFDLSPDGRRLVVARYDPDRGLNNLWLMDVDRGTLSRFSIESRSHTDPVWSHDGRRIAFSVREKLFFDIHQQGTDANARDEVLLTSEHAKYVGGLVGRREVHPLWRRRRRVSTCGCCRRSARGSPGRSSKARSTRTSPSFHPMDDGSLTTRTKRDAGKPT